MSDKKTKQEAPEQEPEMQKQEPPKTETLLIPLDPNGTSDSVYLCVNGRNMMVKRGEPVEVPAAFAEVWRNSQRQEAAALRARQAAASRE